MWTLCTWLLLIAFGAAIALVADSEIERERRKLWQDGYRKDGRSRDTEPARAAGLTRLEKKTTSA